MTFCLFSHPTPLTCLIRRHFRQVTSLAHLKTRDDVVVESKIIPLLSRDVFRYFFFCSLVTNSINIFNRGDLTAALLYGRTGLYAASEWVSLFPLFRECQSTFAMLQWKLSHLTWLNIFNFRRIHRVPLVFSATKSMAEFPSLLSWLVSLSQLVELRYASLLNLIFRHLFWFSFHILSSVLYFSSLRLYHR